MRITASQQILPPYRSGAEERKTDAPIIDITPGAQKSAENKASAKGRPEIKSEIRLESLNGAAAGFAAQQIAQADDSLPAIDPEIAAGAYNAHAPRPYFEARSGLSLVG